MSNLFQPLDVDFFNTLKLAYHKVVDDYQLGFIAGSVPKTLLYQWPQRSSASTANSRQIRGAWAKSGIFPLDQVVMRAFEATPKPASPQRYH